MRRFHRSWPLLVVLCAACAPRSVPERFPAASAASDAAPPGPVAAVTVALREDPPLPGEPSEGWPGLDAHTTESDHHEHGEHTNGAEALYSCPMHSDVTSKEPGKCPRCGMTLVPQK